MSIGSDTHVLFDGTIATTTTVYVGVPVHDGKIGVDIGWRDATTAATITLEFTSHGPHSAPVSEAGDAWEWKGSGETITSPGGTAAGGTHLHFDNVRARRARLKIVTTAASSFIIIDGVRR